MASLLGLGTATDLLELSAELKRRVAARGLGPPREFEHWAERITIDHPAVKALVIQGPARIEGPLHIDYDGLLEHGIGTVVVLGDLVVTGKIINEDSDGGPFFYVDGDVRAEGIEKGGGSFIILGSVNCSGVVLCCYNHGTLLAGGDLVAQAIILNDQEVYVGGKMLGTIVSSDEGNMRTLLVDSVFDDPEDPDCETPEDDLIREHLAEGLPILKDGTA